MSHISAIIFDLGGVILNLNQELTLRAFIKLEANPEDINYHAPLFTDFETGKITAPQFREGLKTHLNKGVSDAQIDEAWNAMLLDLPAQRLGMIAELKKQYPIYLLSNTNSIHIDAFYAYLQQTHGIDNWKNLFDTIYYSHEIGLRKPNADIYEFVTTDIGHKPEHCLFIDDNLHNVQGAEKAGLKTIHAYEPLGENLWNDIIGLVQEV